MPAIEDHISRLERFIHNIPFVVSHKIHIDNRGGIAHHVKLALLFSDGSALHSNEYFTAVPLLEKIAYSYHYQDGGAQLIFRYDNAEHYPEMETFPHHKHTSSGVTAAGEMAMEEVVHEIIRMLPSP